MKDDIATTATIDYERRKMVEQEQNSVEYLKLTSLAVLQYGQWDFEKITTLSLAIAAFTNSVAIAIFAGFGRANILPIIKRIYR